MWLVILYERVRGYYGSASLRPEKWPKTGGFLRDGIALGRGVHRKMGVWIQESRSKFRLKIEISRKIGISGVGVV